MAGYDDPDTAKLVAELQQEYVVRYGGPDATSVGIEEFAAPLGLFLVGYVDGVPVCCGGWRGRTEDGQFADGDAELKRMYVVEGFRGGGLARELLAELERTARAAGRRRLVLETGTRQPEAIALYESYGYTKIPKFGVYRDAEGSRCFAKTLTGQEDSGADLRAG
ncbi:MAG: GNAT family N-acetyltransferase [Sciscionella sp.]